MRPTSSTKTSCRLLESFLTACLERFSQRCSVRLQADRPQVRLKPDTTYYGVVKSAVGARPYVVKGSRPATKRPAVHGSFCFAHANVLNPCPPCSVVGVPRVFRGSVFVERPRPT